VSTIQSEAPKPRTPGQKLLSIEDLQVELGGKSILRGINTSIEKSKITALIGLNGSGKTTLLRAILNEYPYRGRIRYYCGHDHSKPTPEHIGYVPQKLNVDARLPLTVRDLLGLALQRRPLFFGIRRKVRDEMDQLLGRVKANHLLDSLVAKLSGGELQRVLLGLALQPQPELLLLDEPAAGIDFRDQEDFYSMIAGLNSVSGVTILLVSHELNVVDRHAHHVLCLKDGKIQCEGSPHDVLKGDVLADTFGEGKYIYHHHHH